MSLITGLFFLVLLLNQRWSPPLRLQASHCSTFRIICDVPSIAVFCNESIERFPGTASKFFLKLLVTIPVAPIIIGIIVHFRFIIIIIYYCYYHHDHDHYHYINACNILSQLARTVCRLMIALQQELYTTGVSSTLWCHFHPLTPLQLPDSIRGAPQDGEHSWNQPSDDKTKNPKIQDTCPFWHFKSCFV